MAPKDPQLLVFALLCSPFHITSGLFLRPKECGRSPGVWLQTKPLKTWPFPLWCLRSLSLEDASCHVRKVPQQRKNLWLPLNNRQQPAGRAEGPSSKWISPTLVKLPDDCHSGKHLDCTHTREPKPEPSAKPLSNSWFVATVRDSKNLQLFTFIFLSVFVYFERERERGSGGGAERERGRERISEPPAQSPMWGSNSQTMRYDLSQSGMLNGLSHPGASPNV